METAEIRSQACATCASVPGSDGDAPQTKFIYALGQIEPRFPRVSVEKEFMQATARSDTKGKTDRQALQTVLSKRENRYLAREMCWVLSVQGIDTYLLKPHEAADLDLLIQVLEPQPVPWINAVIGILGPMSSPEQCNGLMVPIVAFDQIYTFDRPTLIKAIPKPEKLTAKAFEPAAEELLDRVLLMTDNAGAMDEHRALNYLVMRYPAIYSRLAESFANDYSLTGVDTSISTLSATRTLVDVIFSFTHRTTDFTDKFYTRVDVTEEYPFLVTKLSPYYDR